jgi:membrane-bound lytic murein transglycosylase B
MMRHRVLLPLLLLGACTTPVAKPPPAAPPPPPATAPAPMPKPGFVPPANTDFERWKASYRAAAVARGIPAATVDSLFAGMQPTQRVIDLDRNQPGDGRAARFDAYLARQVDAGRINGGTAAANRMAAPLASAQARTGVPAEIMAAIWGLESAYGKVQGNFDVPTSLATLAWDGRRAKLFTAELDAALDIIAKGMAPRSALTGSWAGAMGQPQFLPSSYLAYAVDGDGDGRADIWNSSPDALASIGNYLQKKGWKPGLSWGNTVTVPAGFDREAIRNPEKPKTCVRPLEKHSRWLPISDWKAKGLTSAAAFPDDTVMATLIEPDGPEGKAYLATANYRVIMEYNCSNFYALSVALLGDAITNRAK